MSEDPIMFSNQAFHVLEGESGDPYFFSLTRLPGMTLEDSFISEVEWLVLMEENLS